MRGLRTGVYFAYFYLSDIRQTLVDSMLKIKQFSIVGLSFYKFFADHSTFRLSSSDELSEVFLEASQSVGAVCGVVVLGFDSSIPFEEIASFGYENESHFYSFLLRGGEQFLQVKNSESACIFLSELHKLYSQSAKFAAVQKIGSENDFLGFILWEFEEEMEEIQLNYLFLFSRLLYSKIRSFEPQISKNDLNFECIELIIEFTPGLKGKITEAQKWEYCLISGSPGTGKKTVAKYLLQRVSSDRKIIVLNSIPDQIGKLEKSLVDWVELSGRGMLVFENIHDFSLAQQRFFYEKFSEKSKAILVFLDVKLPKKEIYPPFWEALNQRVINLPDLDSMDKTHFMEVIKALFREIGNRHHKKNIFLTDEAVNSLKFGNYPQNFHELKNILEHSIVGAKSEKIGLEEISVNSKVSLKSIGELDVEDLNIRRCVAALERQKILLANRLFSGNQIRMAKALGISRGSLQYKMKKMELL